MASPLAKSTLGSVLSILARALVWAASALAIAVVIAVAALALLPYATGWNAVIVLSGSMEPALKTGGLAFVEPVRELETFGGNGVTVHAAEPVEARVRDVAIGDVIAFRSFNDPSRQISHRVIDVIEDDRGTWFQTKGDNSELPDRGLVPAESVVGTIRYHVPYVGYVADWIRHRDSYFVLVGVPAAIVILAELWRIYIAVGQWRLEREANLSSNRSVEAG